jgi:nucleoside-diphosphate-sugar epimerase
MDGRYELVEADVRDIAAVREAVRDAAVVFHQAALASVPRSVVDPVTSHEVNAGGTLNVLVASREAGVRRVVYASSSSVYGDSPELPKREDMGPGPSLRTPSGSSRRSSTAASSRSSTGSSACRSGISMSSVPGRTPTHSTRPSCRSS